MKINNLNSSLVGDILMRLAIPARFGDYASIHSLTASNGIDDDSLEFEFVTDALNMNNNELIEKWYGGNDKVNQILRERSK